MSVPGIVCPFCGEDDFDLIGLKMHLLHPGWCEPFGALELVRLFPAPTTKPTQDEERSDPMAESDEEECR